VRHVPFSGFALPHSNSTLQRASGPVIIFCAPRLIFDGFKSVVSSFHVLCARTLFRRYRGRRLLFSCFALPDSFSTVPTASSPVFMFCTLRLIFGDTEGVGSRFYVLRTQTHFYQYRVCRVLFSCFTRPNTFSTDRGRQLPFSCFARPDSFLAVPRASGPVFIFARPNSFSTNLRATGPVLRARTRFWRYRGRRVPFSCFALLESFSAVPRASCPVFIFFTTVLIFGGTVGVSSRFHVLRARTCFRLYRGCQVPYSCFARTN
jgi:hypothetical protein